MGNLICSSLIICSLLFACRGSVIFAEDSSKEEESLFVARKAFEDGFYEVSLGLLERFLQNYPASVKAAESNLLIGQCYFQQGKFLDALKKFERLLNEPSAKDIKDALYFWIAEVHFKGSDYHKAATYYGKIIEQFPDSLYLISAYYSLGWCFLQEDKFSQALEYFQAAEEKFPGEALAQDASLKVIECLFNLKEYSRAKERVKGYIKLYPQDTARLPYLYFYDAEADYYMDNFEGALAGYNKALRSGPDARLSSLSRLGLGWSYLKLKRYKEAFDAFTEVKPQGLEKKNLEVLLLGKALLMAQTNRFTEASKLYSEILNSSTDPPLLAEAYLGRAEALYNMAEYKEAITSYNEALLKVTDKISQDTGDKLYYGLAWSYLKEGEFKSAIEAFQKIARHSEDKIIKISALCQIGDVYQDSGEYQKAIEIYDSILKDYPDSFYSDYAQYQLGMSLLKTSNYDGAITVFRNLKNKFPDSKLLDDANYSLGLSYFQREDFNSSRELFAKFPLEFKESALKPQAMYLLGASLYNLGSFSDAIEVFKEIIRTYSSDSELVQKSEYEIADCYYQLGNEQEAMARFNALRAKYPDSRLTAEVVWWLGGYYYKHNDLNLARRYFLSVVNDYGKSGLAPDAYYALAMTYEDEEKYGEALDNFSKVIELGKSDLAAQASIAIADISVKQGKIDSAIRTYREVADNYSNLAHLVYPKVADIYAKTGNYREALEFYRLSLELVPVKQMSLIQFKIAEVTEAAGNKEDAIEEYLKVTYLYSEESALTVKALLRVAAIYENKENYKEAANIYQRIISLSPAEAKYARERLDWIKANSKLR